MNTIITEESVRKFADWLYAKDRSQGTVAKYMRDIKRLSVWLNGRRITEKNLIEWKGYLLTSGYEPVTVNSMLAAVNTYCRYLGLNSKIPFFRIQKKLFREESRELHKDEYGRLIRTAEDKGNTRLAMLMETIGATGIRVSEVQYITVEAAQKGQTRIFLKGKVRVILLPQKLCCKLLAYAHKQQITSGEIFITKNGNTLSRKQIWAEMKAICEAAKVEKSKVFPHNFRHLFAQVFYQVTHDIAQLADILGHSSIETTRIYLLSTGTEHMQQLDRLRMVR